MAGAPALIFALPASGPFSLLPAAAAPPQFYLQAVGEDSQVRLTWKPPVPASRLAFYDGTVPDSSKAKAAKVSNVAPGSATVTNLTNGTTYYFWLAISRLKVAGNAPTMVSNMAWATPATTPDAPAGLTATAGNAQVTLSWAAPGSDGGAPVSGYIIYQGTSPDGETGPPVNGSLVTATRFTVTGLANGTTYYFKVIAVNAVGLSPASGEASATLPPVRTSKPATSPASSSTPATSPASSSSSAPGTTPASAFAAPTGLTATAGNTQVRLSWTAPVSDGGSPVTSYKVYLATAPGLRDSAAAGSTKGTAATVVGLRNGTTYYFMVAAVNAAGNESPFSTAVSAKPAKPTKAVTVSLTSPMAPKQLIALLAAIAAAAIAGALTLITRRRRRRRSQRGQPHSRQQVAAASDVRAVPDTGRPDVMSVRDTGPEPTHTVRLEPNPGVITTTIKEGRP